MPTRNDITGDTIVTKSTGNAYREGWDRIFGKKPMPMQVSIEIEAEVPDREIEAQIKADALRAEWWKFCEKSPVILKFEDWYAQYKAIPN